MLIHFALILLAFFHAIPTIIALNTDTPQLALFFLFSYMFWVIGVFWEQEQEKLNNSDNNEGR